MKSPKQLIGVIAALTGPTLLPWLLIALRPLFGLSDGIYATALFLAVPFLWIVLFVALHPCDLRWMAAGFALSLLLLGLVGGGWQQLGLKVILATIGPYSLPWCAFSLVIAQRTARKKASGKS